MGRQDVVAIGGSTYGGGTIAAAEMKGSKGGGNGELCVRGIVLSRTAPGALENGEGAGFLTGLEEIGTEIGLELDGDELVIEIAAGEALVGTREQIEDGHVTAATVDGIGAGDEPEEKVGGSLGAPALSDGLLAFLPAEQNSYGNGKQQESGEDEKGAVAGDVLSEAIGGRLAAGEDGPALQVAAKVFGKFRDGGVAIVGIVSEGAGDDAINVAVEEGTEAVDGEVTVAGSLFGNARGHAGGMGVAGGALGDGGEGGSAEGVGPGQKFVEQHAEAVDVAGGGDGFAPELLGSGVEGSEMARVGEGMDGVDQFGSAEIEETDMAAGGVEEVAGLEVKVGNETAVSGGDGVAGAEDEADAIGDGETVRVGVFVDREAVDALEDEIGLAGGGEAGVEHAADGGVVEADEHGLFPLKAFDGCGTGEIGMEKLEGDGLGDAVDGALGGVDGAGAAAAEQTGDAKAGNLLRKRGSGL